MVTKEIYEKSKREIKKHEEIVKEYERLQKIKGKSECPFCGGSKTTPYVRSGKTQNCNSCDANGMIENRKLHSLDLQEYIKK